MLDKVRISVPIKSPGFHIGSLLYNCPNPGTMRDIIRGFPGQNVESFSTTNFVEGDISVTNGTISSFSGSGTTYNATFTPSGNGACAISVTTGQFTDAAGNNNTASNTFTFTKTSASTGPTQTITSFSVSDGGSTIASSVVMTITPSEDINPLSFTTSDISIVNGTASNLSNPLGNLWSVTVTSTSSGVVKVSVPANAWNGNTTGDGCQASNLFTYTKI